MMIGEALISQIQIALIGIVVVVGLFFVWRSMGRMEEKLDRILDKVQKDAACLPGSNTCAFGWNGAEEMPMPEDAEAAAEEFMRTVFGSAPAPVYDQPNEEVTVVEEIAPSNPPAAQETVVDDHHSEADTDNMNPLSKSKLKKMNIDTLKELCRERGLSMEGSKAVLTDRLLGILRE